MERHLPNGKNQIQGRSRRRAAAILRALENQASGLSLGQIAQRVSLARSTVQRIVAALEAEKFVIAASPTGRVRLGPTIQRLAMSVGADFVSAARPFLVEAVAGAERDRRPRDHPQRPPGVRRPGDRAAAPARGVGGGRGVPAALHRQRQGLSGGAYRRRRRAPDRQELRAAHAEHADAAEGSAQGPQSRRARPASRSTARSIRSAFAPPVS